jgi:hypothetical protein
MLAFKIGFVLPLYIRVSQPLMVGEEIGIYVVVVSQCKSSTKLDVDVCLAITVVVDWGMSACRVLQFGIGPYSEDDSSLKRRLAV